MAVGTLGRSWLGGRSRLGAHSRLGTHSGLGACPGLGTTATAQASLGLLVGSRPAPLRMAMALGAPIATRQIRPGSGRFVVKALILADSFEL
jgi:hypothetical protein